MICPNKNSLEWIDLVNKVGEKEAYKIYYLNNFEIPNYNSNNIFSTYSKNDKFEKHNIKIKDSIDFKKTPIPHLLTSIRLLEQNITNFEFKEVPELISLNGNKIIIGTKNNINLDYDSLNTLINNKINSLFNNNLNYTEIEKPIVYNLDKNYLTIRKYFNKEKEKKSKELLNEIYDKYSLNDSYPEFNYIGFNEYNNFDNQDKNKYLLSRLIQAADKYNLYYDIQDIEEEMVKINEDGTIIINSNTVIDNGIDNKDKYINDLMFYVSKQIEFPNLTMNQIRNFDFLNIEPDVINTYQHTLKKEFKDWNIDNTIRINNNSFVNKKGELLEIPKLNSDLNITSKKENVQSLNSYNRNKKHIINIKIEQGKYESINSSDLRNFLNIFPNKKVNSNTILRDINAPNWVSELNDVELNLDFISLIKSDKDLIKLLINKVISKNIEINEDILKYYDYAKTHSNTYYSELESINNFIFGFLNNESFRNYLSNIKIGKRNINLKMFEEYAQQLNIDKTDLEYYFNENIKIDNEYLIRIRVESNNITSDSISKVIESINTNQLEHEYIAFNFNTLDYYNGDISTLTSYLHQVKLPLSIYKVKDLLYLLNKELSILKRNKEIENNEDYYVLYLKNLLNIKELMGKEEAINKRKAAINYSKAEGRDYKIDVINNYDNYYLNFTKIDKLITEKDINPNLLDYFEGINNIYLESLYNIQQDQVCSI